MRIRLAALVFTLPALLVAQGRPVVRGEVFLADSATRAPGVIVVATDFSGAEVVRALTGSRGEFLVELPGAGRFGFKALRVGYRPTVIPDANYAEGESRTVRIVVGNEAVTIAEVRVRGATSCRIRADSGQLVARVWEQARAALAASQLDAGGRPLAADIVRWEHAIDQGMRVIKSESLSFAKAASPHVFSSESPDSLAVHGYTISQGLALAYLAPDANALLSDQFASLHCFHIEPPPAGREAWLGVAFSPATERRGVAEIEGTLWLDRSSTELRRLEYRYVNLPASSGFGDADGWVEFLRLPTGDWIVPHWAIRMPTTTRKEVSFGVSRTFVTGSRVAGGSARSVTRDGVKLYEDGGDTLVVRLTQRDTIARAANAIVWLEGTSHIVQADTAGRATLVGLIPGIFQVGSSSLVADWVGAMPFLHDVEVVRGKAAEVRIELPSVTEVATRRCGSAGALLVYGLVVDTAGRGIKDAQVVARWIAMVPTEGRRRAPPHPEEVSNGVRTDELGRWSMCIPRGKRVDFEGQTGGPEWKIRDILLPTSRPIVRLDLIEPPPKP